MRLQLTRRARSNSRSWSCADVDGIGAGLLPSGLETAGMTAAVHQCLPYPIAMLSLDEPDLNTPSSFADCEADGDVISGLLPFQFQNSWKDSRSKPCRRAV